MRKLLIISVFCILFITGCTDPEGATKTLQSQGYTHIVITGYRFGQTSEDEDYATGFEAISPAGFHVTGTVTSGWYLKGYTIRLD